MFAFGVRLHQDLDVPVGLIVGAVGGTCKGCHDDYRVLKK